MTLVWRPGYGGAAVSDPDAMAYLRAVEEADNQPLEQGVQQAVNQFVIGCKNDGIWDAIKASCILAGARTLNGALVPLVGTAPTNYNFVSGDYNRKTGLVGNGSTKYLDSNRASTADPAGNLHLAAYQSQAQTAGTIIQDVGGSSTGSSYLLFYTTNYRMRGSVNFTRPVVQAGFVGAAVLSTSLTHRANSLNISQTINPVQASGNLLIYSSQAGGLHKSNARLTYYSIGESLDLAALDTRVSNLMTAIGAAIP